MSNNERGNGKKFKLHFNRVNMQRGKSTVWTVHLADRCIPAKTVKVFVPLLTVFRPESQQPRAWFEGVGHILERRGTVHIVGYSDQGDLARYAFKHNLAVLR